MKMERVKKTQEKLSCLAEGNMPVILETANAIATDNYEN